MTATFTKGEEPWEIGVIFDTDPGQSASYAKNFHAEMQPAAVIAAADAKIVKPTLESVGGLLDAILSIQPEVVPFLEVVPSASMTYQTTAIARSLSDRGRVGGAKLRCGGITPSLFPDVETVASFIAAATSTALAFKATAGLHQPIRHYDPNLDVWRHGFINLLVASAAAASGHPTSTLTDIIEETEPEAFSIGTAFVTWREISIPGPAMRRIRSQGFVGYGSCDFFEPIEALQELSFLGEGT
jgi:hypothetical protein